MIRRRGAAAALILSLASSLLISCGSQQRLDARDFHDARAELPPNVLVLHPELADHLRVLEPVAGRRRDGSIEVRAAVMSVAVRPLLLEYRAVFLAAGHRGRNSNGIVEEILEPTMPWTMVRLEPRQPAELAAVSPSRPGLDVRRHRLEIRWAR
jgi:hypothetical protein